ncbi:MAG: hypothetical protein NZZ41_00305 [Candidatus Dojkabacteria bacterium]|nr:hypothetical protein [Candidatus Dojkabacteria bacterium]
MDSDKDNLKVNIKELLEEIKNFLFDLKIDLCKRDATKEEEQKIVEKCIEIISYWSINRAKIFLKKDQKQPDYWVSFIKEDNLFFFPIRSKNKILAMVASVLLYQKMKFYYRNKIEEQ